MTGICQLCGRKLSNIESIKLGYGKTCYRISQLQQKSKNEDQDLLELKNKWNTLSLKYSILEKKLNTLLESGVQIKKNLHQNTEDIERIKQEQNTPKTEVQMNFMVVIQELKVSIQNGFRLENVPESFMNHKNIYIQ